MAHPYRFHHIGIPTDEPRPQEHYSDYFKMYTADHPGEFRIQFHRFEPDSPLHPLIQKHPHIALQVDELLEATAGKPVLLGPYEPIPGYKVAIINDSGMPIEPIETRLSIEEMWARASQQEDLHTNGLAGVRPDSERNDSGVIIQ